jgi:regulator of protease activity HflC (stomatin/prohibitin superfamily)
MDVFSIIGEVLRSLLKVVPKLIIVRTTHEGIKFKYGSTVTKITSNNGLGLYRKTGIHVYWPLITEVEIIPIRRQTADLHSQYLSTKDNTTIGLSGVLVYEIADVEKTLTACYNYEETIPEIALAAIKKVVITYDFKYLQENGDLVDKHLTKEMRGFLRPYGVRVVSVCLSDFSKCRVLALWGASNTPD